jgi:hypothetical protein
MDYYLSVREKDSIKHFNNSSNQQLFSPTIQFIIYFYL